MTPGFAAAALRRGRPIEQFLGPVVADGRDGIRWVTIQGAAAGFEVVEHAAEIVDDDGFRDLSNFPPLYSDEGRAWGWLVGTAESEEAALALAKELVGASDERWANFGVAGDDYIEWLRQR